MAGISDVAHIAYFITQVSEITIKHIKRNVGSGMAKVTFATYRGPANIHAYMARCDGFKNFFLPCVGVIYFK